VSWPGTITSADARYEESALVDATVKALGLRHTSIPTDTAGFLDRLRTLVRYHDTPVYTITYYALWLLYRALILCRAFIAASGGEPFELLSGRANGLG
jgi:asparagine synthase (glutamine-hydrolysing)